MRVGKVQRHEVRVEPRGFAAFLLRVLGELAEIFAAGLFVPFPATSAGNGAAFLVDQHRQSGRPTLARTACTSSLTCFLETQLRLKRIQPRVFQPAKSCSSSAERRVRRIDDNGLEIGQTCSMEALLSLSVSRRSFN